MHLKLDELISSMEGARNRLVDLQNLSDEELEKLEAEFRRLRGSAARGDIAGTAAVKGEPAA